MADEELQSISEDLVDSFTDNIEKFSNENSLDLKVLYALLLSVLEDVKEQLGPDILDVVVVIPGNKEYH